jgi:hypothetical protein
VDPTKLSDATLRNIIQNTYSASTKDEQQKMYGQLVAARDADLKRPAEASSLAFKSAVKALNNYTIPSKKAIAAPGPAPVEYVLYKQSFTVSFEMNTAHTYKDELQAWMNGALAVSFGDAVEEISVQVQVEPDSTSDSVLGGEASIMVASTSQNPQQELDRRLGECLESVLRTELSQIPANSYIVGTLDPDDINPGTQNGANGTNSNHAATADDGFSDVEELVSNNRPKVAAKNKYAEVTVDVRVM